MIGHFGREHVFPIETHDRGILQIRCSVVGYGRRKRGSKVLAYELAPEGEIELVALPVVMINAEHIHVAVRRERIWHWSRERVVVRCCRICWRR